jgi:hypothetical protein
MKVNQTKSGSADRSTSNTRWTRLKKTVQLLPVNDRLKLKFKGMALKH